MSHATFCRRPETAIETSTAAGLLVSGPAGSPGEQSDSKGLSRRRMLISLLALLAILLPNRGLAVGAFEDPNIEKYAVKKVQPPYPEMAEKYHIEGMVIVRVSVAADGRVSQAEFVRGPNIFRSVSLDAAKRWSFKPPSNEAIAGTIHFTFKLNSSG